MQIKFHFNKEPERFLVSQSQYATYLSYAENENLNLPTHCFYLHNHSLLEVIYVLEGSLTVTCGDKKYEPGPGDMLIFNPYEPHKGVLQAGCSFTRYIVFNFELLQLKEIAAILGEETVSGLIGLSQKCQNYVPASTFTGSMGERLTTLIAHSEAGYTPLCLFGEAACIVGELIAHVGTADSGLIVKNSHFMQTVSEFVAANHMRHIDPEELPKLLNMSHSHFCNLFRKCFGTTFTAWLCDYRLHKAIELLYEVSANQLNISEISQHVGFTNYTYFARCFKKKYGMSMREYIQNNR